MSIEKKAAINDIGSLMFPLSHLRLCESAARSTYKDNRDEREDHNRFPLSLRFLRDLERFFRLNSQRSSIHHVALLLLEVH
jgi:hypothetical protein